MTNYNKERVMQGPTPRRLWSGQWSETKEVTITVFGQIKDLEETRREYYQLLLCQRSVTKEEETIIKYSKTIF